MTLRIAYNIQNETYHIAVIIFIIGDVIPIYLMVFFIDKLRFKNKMKQLNFIRTVSNSWFFLFYSQLLYHFMVRLSKHLDVEFMDNDNIFGLIELTRRKFFDYCNI